MAFLNIKISILGNGTCTTDSHNYLLYSSLHHITRKEVHTFFTIQSDFVVYVVTTLILPENQKQSTSFSMNVANLFLSFKRATTAPNKLIDSQHYKRLGRKILIAFLSHFILRTTQQIDRQSALQTAQKENTDRIPLTFHPQNHAIKSIILKSILPSITLTL